MACTLLGWMTIVVALIGLCLIDDTEGYCGVRGSLVGGLKGRVIIRVVCM